MVKLTKLEILRKVSNKEITKDEASKLLKDLEQKLPESEDSKVWPLTKSQQAIWTVCHIAKDTLAYNLPGAILVDACIDTEVLKEAICRCYRRHLILNQVYVEMNGQIVAKIIEQCENLYEEVKVQIIDTSVLGNLLSSYIEKPFDLEKGPLMRVTLFRQDEGDGVLLINFHHMVFDGTSAFLFLKELMGEYSKIVNHEKSPFLPLSTQYLSFVKQEEEYLNSVLAKKAKEYWGKITNSYNGPFQLSFGDYTKVDYVNKGVSYQVELKLEVTKKLKEFSRQNHVNNVNILLSAYSCLLYLYSDRLDQIIGVPFDGRNRVEYENLVGNFVNMLPVRMQINLNDTYEDLIHQTEKQLMETFDFKEYPYYKIMEDYRAETHFKEAELINIAFYYQNWLKEEKLSFPFKSVFNKIGQQGEYDLTLEIFEEKEIRLNFKFNSNIFTEEKIKQLCGHYENLIEDMLSDPKKSLCKMSFMNEVERNKVLLEWNQTKQNLPSCRMEDLFLEQVKRVPNKTAVVFTNNKMTYKDLNERADKVAETLLVAGARAGSKIGVYCERSIDMLVALLGVFKLGGAYIPIDPSFPLDRIQYILQDTSVNIIISQEKLKERWSELDTDVLLIDADLRYVKSEKERTEALSLDEDLAYIIHTSGSTGKPKGVQVKMKGLVNFLLSMAKEPGILEADYLLAVTTVCFDISTLELFLPLIVGATVEILPSEIIQDGMYLKENLEKSPATIMQGTPSLWKMLKIAGWENNKPLKILCGGEAVAPELAEFLLHGGEREVWNMYGPTETTVWSTVHKLSLGEPIYIGHPIDNTQCYILNQNRMPVPTGAIGELCIGGDGVAKGYLNQEKRTKECFVQNPFGEAGELIYNTGDMARYTRDGVIECLGRSDFQVKINGFRIELGEIEEALQKLSEIEQSVVIAKTLQQNEKVLIAFVVAKANGDIKVNEMKKQLSGWLPSYMIPTRIVSLKTMPMTLNKKVDKSMLQKLSMEQILKEYGKQNTVKEKLEAKKECASNDRILEDVVNMVMENTQLTRDEIQQGDTFGDLGFDSLRFTQLSMKVNEKYSIKIYPTLFYQYESIETFVEYLCENYFDSASSLIKENSSKEKEKENRKIAITGISALLPGADDLETFFNNLMEGKDLVTKFPKERQPKEGEAVDDYGTYIDGVDKFDAEFFEISPREADLMDPQQRLLLQAVWKTIEDSGHKPSDLSNTNTGVYLGVTSTDYQEILSQANAKIEGYTLTGIARNMIANRISYLFNLKGPSSVIDTACSSSLVAIHRACNDIKNGMCDMALAGGINLLLSSVLNKVFSTNGMMSKDNRCKTFDKSADGYVRGEGVGVVLLKPLEKAIEDNDVIYGVILGSAENHGGHTNSLTAPSVNAQSELILRAYKGANISPDTVSYIEAHGTGTPLGDPIEISALKNAFQTLYKENHILMKESICGIGSLKTNIGHLEAAAGVAGMIKVLLAFKHKMIPANIHFNEQNPYIELDNSPFYIMDKARKWENDLDNKTPLRAGVSAFGMGGSNAHIVLEEYVNTDTKEEKLDQNIFVLSAKNEARLNEYVRKMILYLQKDTVAANEKFNSIMYTLQVGREEMQQRLAIVCRSLEELIESLNAYLIGSFNSNLIYTGTVGKRREQKKDWHDEECQNAIASKNLNQIAKLWITGKNVNWEALYEDKVVHRLSLPTYPFAEQRHWVEQKEIEQKEIKYTDSLMPLIDRNESTLEEQIYKKVLRQEQFYLRDHIVNHQSVLPGVIYLEMIRIAGNLALNNTPVIKLKNVMWLQPLTVDKEEKPIWIRLEPKDSFVGFKVVSKDLNESENVHSTGDIYYGSSQEEHVDVAKLKEKFTIFMAGPKFYEVFPKAGFDYGVTFKGIKQISYNEKEALAVIEAPDSIREETKDFVIQPSLMEGALQSAIGLLKQDSKSITYLPYYMGTVRILRPMATKMYAHIKQQEGNVQSQMFDIVIFDEEGNVSIEIKDYTLRSMELSVKQEELVCYKNEWMVESRTEEIGEPQWENTLVIADDNFDLGVVNTGRCYLVNVSNEFREVSEYHYEVATADNNSYELLFEKLSTADIKQVVYCLQEVRNEELISQSFDNLFVLLKVMSQFYGNKPIKFTYIYQAITNSFEESFLNASRGLLRSLQLEEPQWKVSSISFNKKIDNDAVQKEIIAADEKEIKFIDNVRYVSRIKPINAVEREEQDALFKENGVYLITGGTGKIGLQIATYLGNRYHIKCVLNSRHANSEALKEEISLLNQMGIEHVLAEGDISRPAIAKQLVEIAKASYGKLDGVIHCAGLTKDQLIKNKTIEEARSVVEGKVLGSIYLDEATKDEELSSFILFSSISGVFGNRGQSDYAYANAFLNGFASYRDNLVRNGERFGRTYSFNWPLWEDGGIAVNEAGQDMYKKMMGIVPIKTDLAMASIEQLGRVDEIAPIVLSGNYDKIKSFIENLSKEKVKEAKRLDRSHSYQKEKDVLYELMQTTSEILHLPVDQIKASEELTSFGYDSISFMDFSSEIKTRFQLDVTPAIFFEYNNLKTLAEYISKEIDTEIGKEDDIYIELQNEKKEQLFIKNKKLFNYPKQLRKPYEVETDKVEGYEEVAIIGIQGVMPQSDNLDEFWEHLLKQDNLVTEILEDRWNWREYEGDPLEKSNKTNSKWGAFLKEVKNFDASFFGISPKEAKVMDPQQRILLQIIWQAVEDAGYKMSDLSAKRTGIFVGVSNSDYIDVIKEREKDISVHAMIGNGRPYVANRISYLMDLKGPSEAIDTLCSSSLVAIHQAVTSIQNGDSDIAIAGGVNIILRPTLNIFFSKAGMLSPDGSCKAFDEKANGFVRGEGAGCIVLKSLKQAKLDGDRIYAVIRGSAVNHGGHGNTITAPNVNAQADVIKKALERANINPERIGYIEAHGTGTALGDPVEISAITKAFGQFTNNESLNHNKYNYCAIGSVKTNIGHLESAAGIASILKVILALKHKKIPGIVHFKQLNPYIKLKDSPIYIAEHTSDWEAFIDKDGNQESRVAGVSSFGAGGVNAHIILEEYKDETRKTDVEIKPQLITLSARTEKALKQYALDIAKYLDNNEVSLNDMAYTLQMGREPMRYRLALLVENVEESRVKLLKFAEQNIVSKSEKIWFGDIECVDESIVDIISNEEDPSYMENLIKQKRLNKLAVLWTIGIDIDWSKLYEDYKPNKSQLPTYPFEKQIHWIEKSVNQVLSQRNSLHPFIDETVPVMQENKVTFVKTFHQTDAVLASHIVAGKNILPAVAQLEIAYSAMKVLYPDRDYCLRDVVWIAPVEVDENAREIYITISKEEEEYTFEITNRLENPDKRYAKGAYVSQCIPQELLMMNIENLLSQYTKKLDGEDLYCYLRQVGIVHGDYLRSVKELDYNEDSVVGTIELNPSIEEELNCYNLHPALMDGALQGMMAFLEEGQENKGKVLVPFAVDEVEKLGTLTQKCFAYMKKIRKNQYQIAIFNSRGELCVRIWGLQQSALKQEESNMYYKRNWVLQEAIQTKEDMKSQNVVFMYSKESEDLVQELKTYHDKDTIRTMLLEEKEALSNIPNEEFKESVIYYILEKEKLQKDSIVELFAFIKELSQIASGYLVTLKVLIHEQEESNPIEQNCIAEGIKGLILVASKEYPQWKISYLKFYMENNCNDKRRYLEPVYYESPQRNFQEIEIRNGKRYVCTLEPIKIPNMEQSLIKQKGVYIIIGGMGGIGLQLAEYLAKNYKATLILVGVSPLDEERKNKIKKLEAQQSQVTYYQADVRHIDQLNTMVADVKERYGTINGAFHLALELHDIPINEMTKSTFKQIYDVKSLGSYNLWASLREETLDFLVYFSSVQSIFGGIGQAHYVAGCAYEDALAVELNKRTPYPVRVINWGRWNKVGSVSGENYDKRFEAQGIQAIDPNVGITALMNIMHQPCDQVTVFKATQAMLDRIGIQADYRNEIQKSVTMPYIHQLKQYSPTSKQINTMEPTKEAYGYLEKYCNVLLLEALEPYVKNITASDLLKKLNVKEEYTRLYDALIQDLFKNEMIQVKNEVLCLTNQGYDLLEKRDSIEKKTESFSQIKPHITLLKTTMDNLLEILSGKLLATEVIFPNNSNALVEGVYKENILAEYYNNLVAQIAEDYVGHLLTHNPEKTVRILEVGAGTGSTTVDMIRVLKKFNSNIEYTYTDISKSFVDYGSKQFQNEDIEMKFGVLDIEKDIEKQKVVEGQYDMVIAANVLHATKDMQITLMHIKELLKCNGVLVVNEIVENDIFSTLTFGLLTGWWAYVDEENRLSGGPLLSEGLWKQILERNGFICRVANDDEMNQKIIVAESNGVIRKGNNKHKQQQVRAQEKAKTDKKVAISDTDSIKTDSIKADKKDVRNTIIKIIARMLEMEPKEIEPQRPFFEYGIDSISGVELINELNQCFNINMSKAVIFDYSSVNDLTGYVESIR